MQTRGDQLRKKSANVTFAVNDGSRRARKKTLKPEKMKPPPATASKPRLVCRNCKKTYVKPNCYKKHMTTCGVDTTSSSEQTPKAESQDRRNSERSGSLFLVVLYFVLLVVLIAIIFHLVISCSAAGKYKLLD